MEEEKNYPMWSPIGTIYAPKGHLDPYLRMTDDELKEEINKPFINPFAFAVYKKRFHL